MRFQAEISNVRRNGFYDAREEIVLRTGERERMETEVISIETPAAFAEAVGKSEDWLRKGAIVAVPTETVYGLAANAFDELAVEEIYRVKGRPAHNPIIVHVCSLKMARACVSEWPSAAALLAQTFWPGPLTIVLPKSAGIPSVVTAGGDTVGIRWPAHPFMQALIQACQFPVAAPSANPANQISPTQAEHVLDYLKGKIPLIVDAGPATIGIESSVVEVTGSGWRILRPGMISEEQIRETLETEPLAAEPVVKIQKSPGQLPRHYAPRARLHVIDWKNEEEFEEKAKSFAVPREAIHLLCHEKIPRRSDFGRVAVIPNDPEAYARALYAELHSSDAAGAKVILVEALPEGGAWDGVRDRLKRASAET